MKLKEKGFVYREKKNYARGSKALEQVAWRADGCPVHGDTECQTGRGSELLDLAVDVTVHCKGIELDDL